MLTATRLHSRGLDESNAGRHSSARRTLRRALERADDHEVLARIQLSLAHVESELGSAERGLAICNDTLELDGVSRQTRGLTYSQIGLLQMRAGNAAQALPAFAEAIRLLDSSAEPRATAHMNRAILYLQRRDLRQATRDLELALAHARAGGLELLVAKAQHNLGYAKMLAGDLATGLAMMEAARPSWALSPVYSAQCDQDRAEVLLAAGMTQEAALALEAAARSFGSRRLRQRQAEAEFVLARLLLLTDPSAAAPVARRASRRFGLRGSDVWALRADAVALSGELSSGHASTALVQRAGALCAELDRHGLRTEAASLVLHVARALAGDGDVDGACAHLSRARLSKRSPLATRLLGRQVQATVARRKGRRRDAVHHLRRGLAELHAWQSSFGSLDLQSSLVGHGRALALEGLRQAVDDGRPEVVFEWAERARALASRVAPVRPPSDPEAASDLAELRQLQIELAEAQPRGGVSRQLDARAELLRSRIRQRAWYGEGSGLVTEPAGLDEVAGALQRSGGAALSYLAVGGQVYCLVVGGDQGAFVHLGPLADVRAFLDGMRADLDLAAARLPAVMAAAVRASLDERLRLLARALVEPVLDSAGDGPVVVAPSGALAGVPWSLLSGFRERPLTVPRSVTSWLAECSAPFALGSVGFVAGPGVGRAHEEVARASRPWGRAETLVGDEAHSEPVHRLASRVDVFHAAAHGRHSADNPLFSGLELVDGAWFGYDIDQLDRIPSTVVLSACELGRSSVRWGEETVGMTVAWLHAGARCVIASPALVNDDAACEVLAGAHARLAEGSPPALALSEATCAVDDDAPAPFICFGSGW